jgi:hypothetical protein
MIEIKTNNKIYYELVCEKCNNKFKRRKDEFFKNLKKCNNKILCCECMRARKYEELNFKVCSKCKKEKMLEEFYKRNKDKRSYCSQCKECMNNNNKKWRNDNKDILKIKQKEYRNNNKEKVFLCSKRWKNNNKELIKQYRRNDYYRHKKDNFYKLKIQTRHLITKAFERKGYKKNSKTEKILCCDYKTFINYLLETYKNNYGIEWDGKIKVHIDHIIPLSTAKSEEDIIKLNHYTNLQLLKAEDNLCKSNKLDWRLDND